MEIAHDYSTDAFILVLRNFMNLRGKPRRVYTDNGTNFVGFKDEVVNVVTFFDWARIMDKFAPPDYHIEWHFNSPLNPAEGGRWERLVGSVKRTLEPILKERAPHEHTLRSFLLEAMNIVNSRPLTHVPIDHEEEEPLTPNHWIIGHSNSTQTPVQPDSSSRHMRKQWKISQLLKDHFWARWVKEHLPNLLKRAKWHDRAPPLEPGQLVMIVDPETSRNDWRRGRIVEVSKSRDGQTRSALVKTTKGILRRSANRLAVLDVTGETRSSFHGGGNVAERDKVADVHVSIPQRVKVAECTAAPSGSNRTKRKTWTEAEAANHA